MSSSKSRFRFAALVVSVAIASTPLDLALARGAGAGGGNGGGNGAAGAGHASAAASSSTTNEGNISSQLGALNAAHASKTAFAHANPRSRVGKIATYASTRSAASLAAAANKTVTAAVQTALNALIGNK